MDKTDTQAENSKLAALSYPKVWWLITTAVAATLVLGLGALIAIPIAAALRVLVREVIAPAIRRQTGAKRDEGKSK